jgi:hypothetical protein
MGKISRGLGEKKNRHDDMSALSSLTEQFVCNNVPFNSLYRDLSDNTYKMLQLCFIWIFFDSLQQQTRRTMRSFGRTKEYRWDSLQTSRSANASGSALPSSWQ